MPMLLTYGQSVADWLFNLSGLGLAGVFTLATIAFAVSGLIPFWFHRFPDVE